VAGLYRELGVAVHPVATNAGVHWPAHGFLRRPGVIVYQYLEPIPPGLKRAEFMRLREADFVSACRLMGMSPVRIVLVQMLPNAIPPIVVSSSIMVASAILIESGLAFLGLGDPNVISWGTMVGMGRSDFRAGSYLVIVPGLAIMLCVLALNLLGDGLNDALNTRLNA
jgi:peptide/nickel transport system permease protein